MTIRSILLGIVIVALSSTAFAQDVPRPVNAPSVPSITPNNELCSSGNPQQALDCGYQPGISVGTPNTGTLETLLPTVSQAGPTKAFGTPDLFKETRRSNSGSGMTDTFPASTTTGLVNGTRIIVTNIDSVAIDTITAGSGTTIAGNSTDIIEAGRSVQYSYDGAGTWRKSFNTGTAAVFSSLGSNVSGDAVSMRNIYGGVQDSGKVFPSGTIVGTSDAQTLTNKSVAGSEINSGVVGSSYGGAGTVTGALRANGAGAVSQAACSDLTNAAASCSTDTTNASHISSGTLAFTRMPTIGSGDLVGNATSGSTTPADTSVQSLLAEAAGTAGTTGQAWCTGSSWCSNRQAFLMASSATQAASTTLYYPCSGSIVGGASTQAAVSPPFPFSGTLKNFYIIASGAPSGTITATVFVNGVSPGTGPAVTLSGSTTAGSDTTHAVAISAGQTCDVQIVTGAGTTSVSFSTGLEADNP